MQNKLVMERTERLSMNVIPKEPRTGIMNGAEWNTEPTKIKLILFRPLNKSATDATDVCIKPPT
jgi:hypothetical protein